MATFWDTVWAFRAERRHSVSTAAYETQSAAAVLRITAAAGDFRSKAPAEPFGCSCCAPGSDTTSPAAYTEGASAADHPFQV